MDPHRFDYVLLRADGEPDGGEIDALLRLAGYWFDGLSFLRPPPQHALHGQLAPRKGGSTLMIRRVCAGFVALSLIVVFRLQAVFGWGENAERLITNKAVDPLPEELLPFFESNRQFIVQHVTDPNESKDSSNLHSDFIQLDHYGQ